MAGKHKLGEGPVNTNLVPGRANTNWEPGAVNTTLGPGPVNKNWEPGPGAGKNKHPKCKETADKIKE